MDQQSHTRHAHLPVNLRRLFWSYRFEELDPTRDEKTIMVQILNYGSLAEWRWLVRAYGTAEVRRVLGAITETEIKPRTRALASLLFSIPDWRHAQ
jgi:hypothetical protein